MNRFVAALSLAITLPLAGCSSGPDDVASEFTEAAYSGKTAEALERLDPSVVQMGGPKLMAALAAEGRGAAEKGGLKNVRSFGAEIQGDYATVQVERTFADGSQKTEKVKMRQVNGEWYVTM